MQNPWLNVPVDPRAQFFASLQAPAVGPTTATPVAPSLVQSRIPPSRPAPRAPKPMPVMTPELERSLAEITRGRSNMSQVMGSNNAELEAQLAALSSKDFQTDLSPLAALVDEWSGSNIAQGYRAPESVADRQKQIAGVSGALQQGRAGLANAELEGLEADLARQMGLHNAEREQAYKSGRDAVSDDQWAAELQLQKDRLAIDKEKAGAKGPDLKTLPTGALDSVTDSQDALSQMLDVEELITGKGDIMGPFEGLFTKNPYETDHKLMDAKFRIAAQTVGKYLEGGKLMKEDERKYEEMLPRARDTKEVAAGKMENVKQLLQKKIATQMENYTKAGYDTVNFQGDMKANRQNIKTLEKQEKEADEDKKVIDFAKSVLANPLAPADQKEKARKALEINGVQYGS